MDFGNRRSRGTIETDDRKAHLAYPRTGRIDFHPHRRSPKSNAAPSPNYRSHEARLHGLRAGNIAAIEGPKKIEPIEYQSRFHEYIRGHRRSRPLAQSEEGMEQIASSSRSCKIRHCFGFKVVFIWILIDIQELQSKDCEFFSTTKSAEIQTHCPAPSGDRRPERRFCRDSKSDNYLR